MNYYDFTERLLKNSSNCFLFHYAIQLLCLSLCFVLYFLYCLNTYQSKKKKTKPKKQT